MRPLRLDLAGFTVFRDPVTIDFTDADFFALVGPTGSGKSTVLDAICFALYGTVPRWGDRRAIANALAPSAVEGRVRLVFESAGARYVLTRVVRRDGKGTVSTRQAGLEAIPAEFDLALLDGAATPGVSSLSSPTEARRAAAGKTVTTRGEADLGRVLAGTPSEVDGAVVEVIGLPYEQFTKCVVLPQGEFAAFLHAKPAERQRILVNLLGLEVYGRIRERAGGLASAADAQLAATDQLLAALSDADDDAVAAAAQQVAVLGDLVAEVDRVVPELVAAHLSRAEAKHCLADIDSEVGRLQQVRVPDPALRAASGVASARSNLAAATATVTAAEEGEEKLRAELTACGATTTVRQLLDGYADAQKLEAESEELARALAGVEAEHSRAAAALHEARDRALAAHADLDAAREAYQAAVAVDRAAALRPHLRPGEPCPVCEHPVATVPQRPHEPQVAAAETAGASARRRADAADAAATRCDAALREIDLEMARARERTAQLAARRRELDERLAGAPEPASLRAQLDTIAELEQALQEATARVRAARSDQRALTRAVRNAEEHLARAWREFDAVRDGLSALGPPPVDRDDLAGAWQGLTGWATTEAADRQRVRGTAVAAVEAADCAVTTTAAVLLQRYSAAGVPVTGWDCAEEVDPTDLARTAAVARERAEADHRRTVERRADAERLRAQRVEREREGRVARALAGHLRSDRFERWLLAEALGSLVADASRILRELSAGHYDLTHDKGEFFVIDHHDAGLRRGVRTLSGGETFQASLALALALSEQLAGMSTTGASLESILLDEGFGTLDASTLDTVAASLENLAARGDRMVGVVTHVGALADRVPVRFELRRDGRSARVERVGP